MEQSTQWGVSIPNTFPMEKPLKSGYPALNVPMRHEPVATDTVFLDTPAIDSGVQQTQVFLSRDTIVADAYPMKSGKQFVNTLEDLAGEELWISYSVILPTLSYSIRSSGHITFQIVILCPTTRTKPLLNGHTGLSSPGLTL